MKNKIVVWKESFSFLSTKIEAISLIINFIISLDDQLKMKTVSSTKFKIYSLKSMDSFYLNRRYNNTSTICKEWM